MIAISSPRVGTIEKLLRKGICNAENCKKQWGKQ